MGAATDLTREAQTMNQTPNTAAAPAFESLGVHFAINDVSRELARRAFVNTSHYADQRADSTRAAYLSDMQRAAAMFEEAARQHPDRKDRAADMLRDYKSGYLKRLNDYLSSHAGCASWFIVGPARFPARRQEKRRAAADKRAEELQDFATRRLARMVKLITRPARMSAQERADDLRRRVEQAEAEQARMKEANKVIRDKKMAEKLQAFGLTVTDALVTLGIPEAEAVKIQDPKQFGGMGYPSCRLTNNGAEIRRLKGRLATEQAKAAQAHAGTAAASEYDTLTEGRVRYEEHPDDNRVRLIFEDKPSEVTRATLKGHGFRWSPSNGAWQRILTPDAVYYARQVLKVLGATPAQAQAESAA